MALNQHASNLVSTTINAFNGDVASVSPMDGISLIDSWLSALHDTGQATNPVRAGLSELKAELQSGNPDGAQIQRILEDLADQVTQAGSSAEADVKTKLGLLAEALRNFSKQLGGSSKTKNTQNRQAPMTSTVGGESTNSGTGASALGDNDNEDDDLTDRNGGTVDRNDSAMGMDDQTGSDGGQTQTGGSTGDDYSAGSGTQRSGVSGGSADSGSGSSGGRSQY